MTKKIYENKENPEDANCYTHELLVYTYEDNIIEQQKIYTSLCEELYKIAQHNELQGTTQNINQGTNQGFARANHIDRVTHEITLLNQKEQKDCWKLAANPFKNIFDAEKTAQIWGERINLENPNLKFHIDIAKWAYQRKFSLDRTKCPDNDLKDFINAIEGRKSVSFTKTTDNKDDSKEQYKFTTFGIGDYHETTDYYFLKVLHDKKLLQQPRYIPQLFQQKTILHSEQIQEQNLRKQAGTQNSTLTNTLKAKI